RRSPAPRCPGRTRRRSGVRVARRSPAAVVRSRYPAGTGSSPRRWRRGRSRASPADRPRRGNPARGSPPPPGRPGPTSRRRSWWRTGAAARPSWNESKVSHPSGSSREEEVNQQVGLSACYAPSQRVFRFSQNKDLERHMSEEAFIYEAIRTPRGKGRNGSLHEVKPISLVTGLIDEMRRRYPDLDENLISDIILGVVSPVGDQGAVIARTAVLASGMPETTGGVQINRFCASGLEAVNMAAQKVRSGWDDLVLAGGVESMSRVPMGSDGGAWATDPDTNYTVGFVPQGIGADLIATIE